MYKNKAMGLFLRHVRIVDITDVAEFTTDAIGGDVLCEDLA